MRRAALLSCLLLACAASSASAQPSDKQSQARVRQATRSALNVFLAAGTPALRKSIETCYEKANIQQDPAPLFLEIERCTATDQLGLIVFTAEKRRMTRLEKPYEDAFLNPEAHRARVNQFWAARGMPPAQQEQIVEAIFAVVYDEFTLQLPGIAMPAKPPSAPATAPPPANPTAASPAPKPDSLPRSTPTPP